MTVTTASLKIDCCYRTVAGEIVKIVAFDGSRVVYVLERGGIYPIWNRAMWRVMSKPEFAQQIDREVVCR